MKIPIFLSYPRPHYELQQKFLDDVINYLDNRGLMPRTLGVTDYDTDVPLKAIRRLMLESYGLISIAFQRTKVISGLLRKGADIQGQKQEEITNKFYTSPYCQIEPAMAFQLGLPILLFRQKGVIAEGVLERGVVGLYMPEFSVGTESAKSYLASREFNEILPKWEAQVRKVVETRGNPPQLY